MPHARYAEGGGGAYFWSSPRARQILRGKTNSKCLGKWFALCCWDPRTPPGGLKKKPDPGPRNHGVCVQGEARPPVGERVALERTAVSDEAKPTEVVTIRRRNVRGRASGAPTVSCVPGCGRVCVGRWSVTQANRLGGPPNASGRFSSDSATSGKPQPSPPPFPKEKNDFVSA